jgi:hypothetical protein
MSEIRLLSYLRRGAASLVDATDRAAAPMRFATQAGLTVAGGDAVAVPVTLYGPADVVGLSGRQITRRTPGPGATGIETGTFPSIEFAEADLPWRYTPIAARAIERLRPWLVLVAIEQRPGRAVVPAGGAPLPVIEAPLAELPDLGEADLWAHVQATLPDGGVTEPLPDYLERNPSKAIARLLCPRRLAPNTVYLVCLVPAFEVGRLAGLGKTITAEQQNLALAWAYNPASPDARLLPVYDHWRFTTGAAGNFESLARHLAPYQVSVGAELLLFEVDRGIAPPSTTMHLAGALRPVRTGAPPDAPVPAPIAAALAARINRAADLADTAGAPQVAAQLYGRWQAGRRRVAQPDGPVWLDRLNTDPRHRIAAAAGGDVVQRHQEEFAAAAWAQIGQLRPVNGLLRGAQTARSVADRLKARHFDGLPDDLALQVGGPLLARVQSGTEPTLYQALANSALPEAGFEGAFRRISRVRGPHLRRYGMAQAPDDSAVLLRHEFVSMFPEDWQRVDQGNINAPSDWRITPSVVTQHSNIHSAPLDAGPLEKLGSMLLTGNSTWRDQRFSFYVEAEDDDAVGCVFRYRNTGNYYRFSMDSQRSYRRLVKCQNNTFTLLWQDGFRFEPNTRYRVQVLAEGSRIRVWMGDTSPELLADVTDTAHPSGRVGLYTWGNDSARFSTMLAEHQTGIQAADIAGRVVDEGNTDAPSRWTLEGGAFFQRSNIYSPPHDRDDLAKKGTFLRIGSPAWTDYSVEMRLGVEGDNDAVGFMFRYLDPRNYYRLSMDRERSYIRLVRCKADAFTLLWQQELAYEDGKSYQLRVVADGARLRGYLMGLKLFDLRDRSHLRGDVALYCWGAPGAFFNRIRILQLRRDGIMARLNLGQFDEMPVPPDKRVPLDRLAADYKAAMQPHQLVKARVLDRVRLPARRTSADPLEPERPEVRLPAPLAPKLAEVAPELFLPRMGQVPDGGVVMLETNPAFVAAFMVGANHEMARELQWRGLPVDLKGTVFRQFWDVRDSGERTPDIGPIHVWPSQGDLAAQVTGGRPRSVFLIRSEIIRRFPDLAVSLVQAVRDAAGRRPGTVTALPQFGGRVGEDMAFYGFAQAPAAVAGGDGGAGWYLLIEQRSVAAGFGLDLSLPPGTRATDALPNWSNLAWPHLRDGAYVRSTALLPPPPAGNPVWARNGAHMAAITRQQPVRIFIHAGRLVAQGA